MIEKHFTINRSDGTLTASIEARAIVTTNETNKGYEFCLNVGYTHANKANYDLMITMDADGQLPLASIPKLLDKFGLRGGV